MADSPPEVPQTEADIISRKIELVGDLRALVASPGWAYLCNVLRQQAWNVKAGLQSVGSMDDLVRINAELREAETYIHVLSIPEATIAEFQAHVEAYGNDD